jgi:hypothetical protein
MKSSCSDNRTSCRCCRPKPRARRHAAEATTAPGRGCSSHRADALWRARDQHPPQKRTASLHSSHQSTRWSLQHRAPVVTVNLRSFHCKTFSMSAP